MIQPMFTTWFSCAILYRLFLRVGGARLCQNLRNEYVGHAAPSAPFRFFSERSRSHDLLFKFWDPLHISETVSARNFKFGTQINYRAL